MARVVVAGSTGYLGKHVVAACKRRGHWVRALARSPEKLSEPGVFLEPAVGELVDEVFTGEATRPETLSGLCDGADMVFSSLGITRQTDKVSFRDVDYQANRNILDLALKSGVKRFVFVSVFRPGAVAEIGMVRAREDFVKELRSSGLFRAVIRPTGFFSDISEYFHMAKAGRVWMVGDGSAHLNPIHGADLAEVCVDALETTETEIEVGGPETFTHREIAELAFSVAGGRPKISALPAWAVNLTLRLVRPFSERYYDLGRFFATASQTEFTAPPTGSHRLEPYFRELLGRG